MCFAVVWICGFHAVLSAQIPFGGIVADEFGQPMAGVQLRLIQPDGAPISQTVTDDAGRFSFSNLSSGAYRIVAEKPGFFVVERNVSLSSAIVADVVLSRKPVLEDSVSISARPDGIELKDARPSLRETITNEQLDLLPTGNSRNFLNALPLSSSIVRDREGRLHVRGAGSQSIQYVVDGVNVTDPVTGNLRGVISSESIESVDIVASGYAPEFGRSSGGLVRVETALIPDKWRFTATDIVPNYSFRQRAIAELAPRVTALGPVGATRLSLMYTLSGEYRNSFNEDLPRGENAEGRVAADHLIKARYVFSDLHLASATVLLNQRRLTHMGLTSQSPIETTTNTTSHDYTAGVRDRLFFDQNTLLESALQFSITRQDTRAMGAGLFRIWPNRRRGNNNVDEKRDSRRLQWNENLSWSVRTGGFVHRLKTGTELTSAVYRPDFSIRPIEFYRRDETLLRRTWYDGGRFAPSLMRETGFFVQDTVSVRPDLTLTYGLRTDWDSITREYNPAPRLGFAWYPGRTRRTRISGGIGYFYDRLLLTHLIQDQFPRRIESVFSDDGSRAVATYTVQRMPPQHLQTPLSRNWEFGVEREIFPDSILRASYLKRSGRRELRQIDTAPPPLRDREVWLAMTNTGMSDYKSFDISTENSWKNVRLSLSYTWSRALQSLQIDPFALNLYENVYEVAPADWDAPHRLTGWAMFPFFKQSRAGFVVEARSGFPFSIRDDFTSIVGNRNSYRFPAYFNLGLSLEREVPFTRKYRLGVRLSAFNLTNHFNPNFVDSNLTSPDFLQFGNSPRPSGNIRLRLIKRP